MSFVHNIFEDPQCSDLDDAHPIVHAAKNLGTAVRALAHGVIRESFSEGRGILPQDAYGIAVLALLAAAEDDPEWARAILAAADPRSNQSMRHNGQLIRDSFPLSPLDKAVGA